MNSRSATINGCSGPVTGTHCRTQRPPVTKKHAQERASEAAQGALDAAQAEELPARSTRAGLRRI